MDFGRRSLLICVLVYECDEYWILVMGLVEENVDIWMYWGWRDVFSGKIDLIVFLGEVILSFILVFGVLFISNRILN